MSAGSDDSTTRFLLKSVRLSSNVMNRLFQVVGQAKVTTSSDTPLLSTGWLGTVGRPEVVGTGRWSFWWHAVHRRHVLQRGLVPRGRAAHRWFHSACCGPYPGARLWSSAGSRQRRRTTQFPRGNRWLHWQRKQGARQMVCVCTAASSMQCSYQAAMPPRSVAAVQLLVCPPLVTPACVNCA